MNIRASASTNAAAERWVTASSIAPNPAAASSAVIAAIYAKVYPEAAASKLPAGSEDVVNSLYLGGAVQSLTFAEGTPERTAADYAMQQVQKWGGVAATCVLIMAIPGILLWKNYKLDKKQNKGTVF